jgi:hypothetical protein
LFAAKRPSPSARERILPIGQPELEALWREAARQSEEAAGRLREPIAQVVQRQHMVLLMCADEKQQLALLERFLAEGLECKALLSWQGRKRSPAEGGTRLSEEPARAPQSQGPADDSGDGTPQIGGVAICAEVGRIGARNLAPEPACNKIDGHGVILGEERGALGWPMRTSLRFLGKA